MDVGYDRERIQNLSWTGLGKTLRVVDQNLMIQVINDSLRQGSTQLAVHVQGADN